VLGPRIAPRFARLNCYRFAQLARA